MGLILNMGNVFAEITISNCGDLTRARDGSISENEVRELTVTAIVDTGATALVINEEMCQKLGLAILETRSANLAGGVRMPCKITEPVQICWKDRSISCGAMVFPETKVLLGVIPLEFMDLMVDPVRQELVGANGDQAMLMAM